ncbi:MAG TPA: IS21-like element helper ATPase IstB [Stellaceae bacterium]|nr:IS21-like element helper ATPase IstB [Stellaceae bacterium]
MTHAKLSGSLLACKEAPATPPPPRQGVAAPSVALVPAAGEDARLLADRLKALKLPAFLREYDALARQCAAEGLAHWRYLSRLAEIELNERHARRVERLIRKARFPAVKSLDDFDFAAIPSLDRRLVQELAQCEYLARRENIVAVGGIGTGKTHLAIGLGLAACRKGHSVGFTTAAALVHELIEARAGRRVMRLERRLDACGLLIIDDFGYAPLSGAGTELLFEVVSRRSERGSTIITSDLPIKEWVGVFGSERLTGALLDRLSWRLHIIEMNGESYRLEHGNRRPPPFSTVADLPRRTMRLAADRGAP